MLLHYFFIVRSTIYAPKRLSCLRSINDKINASNFRKSNNHLNDQITIVTQIYMHVILTFSYLEQAVEINIFSIASNSEVIALTEAFCMNFINI